MYTHEQTATFPQRHFGYLLVEEKDRVLRIALNRPEKKNALNPAMLNELAFAVAYAGRQPGIWAVVLEGRGNVFCAGADLTAFGGGAGERQSDIPAPEGEVLPGELFSRLHKPSIALVEGDVYAGGFLLLTGCTYVLAARGIKLGLPEAKRGLFPFQVLAGLLEHMPARKALDWCIRGYNLPAEEALTYGLITQLAEPEELEASLQALLKDILANSPSAIRLGMEAYDYLMHRDSTGRHQYLREMLMRCLQTRDAMEGIAAFREKRQPEWSGE